MSSLHRGFQETGPSADSDAALRWLDLTERNLLIHQAKRRMLDVCPVGLGDQVLDVGCGPGHEVFRLARRVGPHGRVVGIDANLAMITEARRRAEDLGLPVAFEVSDACHVPFPDSTFDLCRAERVLRYVDEPESALREMVRLTRPGGSVQLFEFDSDLTVVDAPDSALTRRIAELLDSAVPQPWIGRQLFGLFKRAGLRDVRVVSNNFCFSGATGFAIFHQFNSGTIDRAVQAGQIAASDVAAWWATLERGAETETFFAANLGFIVAGSK
jgi:ubiquinone/menaquinone biosynthesis C-methylase UbiE